MLLRLSKANIDVYCYKQTTFSQLFLFRIKLLGKAENRSREFLLEVRISLLGTGKRHKGIGWCRLYRLYVCGRGLASLSDAVIAYSAVKRSSRGM